jgi:predicted MFS family arabinose efflux permease
VKINMMQATESSTSLKLSIPAAAVPLLSLAAFASAISARVTDPLLPNLSREFGVSLGDASNVITFFAVAYGLSQLFFGPLGDRYGKYFVVACASIGCALTAALCAVAPNFQLLLAARLLAGATAAALIPLSMAWIGDVVPYQQRQPVLARFLVGHIFGLSMGAFFGGLAGDTFGWRLPFFGIALIFLVIGIVLLLLNRRLPAHARVMHKAEGAAIPRMVKEFRQVLAKPWARMVLLTVALEGAFLYGAFAFIATHLHHTFGMSLTASGAMVMLFGFGGLLFAAASGAFVSRLGEVGLSLWGGLFVAGSLLTIGVTPVWWWAIPGCFFAGFGFYMLHNTLQTNATQMAPERRGAAVSSFACCYFMGQSVGVALAGAMVEQAGTAAVIVVGAIGVLAVALNFTWRLKSKALG